MNNPILFILFSVIFVGCTQNSTLPFPVNLPESPFVLVLGVTQDAGYPQMGCYKSCCVDAWKDKNLHRSATCLAVIDPTTGEKWLFEATPDIKIQLDRLKDHSRFSEDILPDGIFLTHAHMGHYTGLMHFGREVMGASGLPVYAMPRMRDFLSQNGPWSQLVELKNVALQPLKADSTIQLNAHIEVTPFLVPHRDEYSETVGYRISGKENTILFIPDIDKWEKWERFIIKELEQADFAFLDGTFYKNGEIPGRNMSEIPHPFIEESMALFSRLSPNERAKVHFIHFNHTNPVLKAGSPEAEEVLHAGFRIARELMVFEL